MKRTLARVAVTALVAALLPALPAATTAASAATSTVGYTLEGCRNDGPPDPAPYPAAGPYICTAGAYTTGNLGKGWAELDLVPHRISLTANQAEPGTTLTLAGDQQRDATDNAIIGWDYISVPVLNVGLSNASGCDATVTDGGYTNDGAAVGGTFKTARRVFTVDVPATSAQQKCVYDYYQRLSLGSGGFPGSSLQSYILDSQGGKKTISIPVPVLKQTANKDMTATQNSDFAWNVVKTSDPTSLTLTDTCATSGGSSGTVNVTITWTRYAAVQGGPITLIANVYASNPSSRDLSITITDRNYAGSNPDPSTDPVLVTTPALSPVTTTAAARTFTPVHVATFGPVTVADGPTAITDIATIDYTDPVVGDSVGTLNPQATATVQSAGTPTNATATVTDTESITGNGLSFSVATPSVGGFTGGPAYVAGTHTTGPVTWSSGTVSGSGSVTFNKTVYAAHGTSTSSGVLTDTATLTTSGNVEYTSNVLNIPITSTANASITVTKTVPNVFQGTDTASFVLHLASGSPYSAANDVASHTFTFTSSTPVVNGRPTLSFTFTGLTPGGTYTLHEDAVSGWAAKADTLFTLTGDFICGDSVTINNSNNPAKAAADKVTVPAGFEGGYGDGPCVTTSAGTTPSAPCPWTFQLSQGATVVSIAAADSAGHVNFGDLPGEGSYTITEVLTAAQAAAWDQTSAVGCSFTVNYPANNDQTFTCTITNTQRGHIVVYKHTDPSGDAQGFTFTPNYNGGATFVLHDGESNDSGALVPCASGVTCYNVSEAMPTGWRVDPNHATTCSDGTTSYAPSAIQLKPGKTVTCHFYNQKLGHAKVIKTLNGAALSGSSSFNFELRSGATSTAAGTIIGSGTANAGNGGVITFATNLNPGQTYQLCETGLLPNWHTSLENISGYFSPGPAPVDNSTICVNFTVAAGELKVFNVDNTSPGGDARTIGFWKNWTSCDGKGKQAHVLDQTLALAEPGGISVGTLVLHGSTSTPNTAPSCLAAIRILDKSRVDTGAKSASDPVFAFASQYLAARLNYVAGAKQCSAATSAMTSGQSLLVALHFNGSTHDALTSTQKSQLLSWASTLDKYNNNQLC